MPYCENCPDFKPEIFSNKTEIHANNLIYEERYDHVIKCRYANRCENIAKYIAGGKDKNEGERK